MARRVLSSPRAWGIGMIGVAPRFSLVRLRVAYAGRGDKPGSSGLNLPLFRSKTAAMRSGGTRPNRGGQLVLAIGLLVPPGGAAPTPPPLTAAAQGAPLL